MDRLLYTVEEAAQTLGLGRTKAYDLIKSGELASVRIGRSRRIPSEALTAFIAQLLSSQESPAAVIHRVAF